MQTIVILLNPIKLENADLDLRYFVPKRIEQFSNGIIKDNGYDYIDTKEGQGPLMGIWLETKSASESWQMIVKLFQNETFKGNDLSMSAEIFLSENDNADLENCTLVFPK